MSVQTIEQSPIYRTIKRITSAGGVRVANRITAQIHIANDDIPIMKVLSIDTHDDYVANICSYIRIRFDLGFGDYVKRLYPARANLEVTIKKVPLDAVTSEVIKNTKPIIERYKAVIIPDENPQVSASDFERMSIQDLNISNMVTVTMQLLPLPVEALRLATVQDVYSNHTAKDIMAALMFDASSQVKMNGKTLVDGIDIVEPDNTKAIKTVVIPSGTMMSSLPTFMQNNYGVYTGGIGTFLTKYKNGYRWFIYPLYKSDRFNTKVPRAVFYALPKERFTGEVNTYEVNGNLSEILVVGNRSYRDQSDIDYMNDGVGFRMADASAFMRKPVKIEKGEVIANRSKLNHEVAHKGVASGVNYAPVSETRISNNPYMEYSKILMRGMGRVDITWHNANPDLIYPGMPCQFVWLEKNLPKKVNGVVLMAHVLEAIQGTRYSNNNVYKTSMQLVLATETLVTEPDTTQAKSFGEF